MAARSLRRRLGRGSPDRRCSPIKPLFGSAWGLGMMKPRACDYCDDVVGETADVSVGDAWLPQYRADTAGTNIIVVRSARIDEMIERARREKSLELQPVHADLVARSQVRGFHHRRTGLGVRLAHRQSEGHWTPPKRVAPNPALVRKREGQRMLARERIAEQSHIAFAEAAAAGDLAVMKAALAAEIAMYYRLSRPSAVRRLASRAKAIARLVRPR